VVASTVDTTKEKSLRRKEQVNSSAYLNFHNGQMFADGLSFSGHERNPTWINTGGSFADLSAVSGADLPNDSRSLVAADFDDDGDIDLFVHSIQRERHALLRNDISQDHNFLKLHLLGTSGNPEAIGAIVRVAAAGRNTAQVLSRGGGFTSCQPPELIFGLGNDDQGTVEVLWPGGKHESFGTLPTQSRALLVEGTGMAMPFERIARTLPDPLPPGLRAGEGESLARRFAALDAEGNEVALDLVALADGHPLLLNFWASYCSPCVAEVPLLQSLSERGEMKVVALSVDVASDRERAVKTMKRVGTTFPAFYLRGDEENSVAGTHSDANGNTLTGLGELVDLERLALPTSIIISPTGRIESILRGPLESKSADGPIHQDAPGD